MSLGNISKCIANNIIFPSKTNTIPFTVPSLLDKRRRHWILQRDLSPKDSSPDSCRWSSEPFLLSGSMKRISNESELSDDNNKSSDSIMFGIDPSLYQQEDLIDLESSFSEDNIGRLWFAIQYNPETERLAVSLIQLRNLPSRVRGVNNGCDPYVRICLLPDEKRYLQSQCKKKTCNPKFDENFVFQVSVRDVRQRSLKFTVYDINRNKNHVVIGHVVYPLNMFDLSTKVALWRDLENENVAGNKAETKDSSQIYISLSYNGQLSRLTVGVYTGKNFKVPPDADRPYEIYVRVIMAQMNKVLKQKKSSSIKNSKHPTFNEMFKLKLSPSDLDSVSLSVVVFLHQHGCKDISIGRVVLGSFMFARGAELDHWSEMTSNEKQQISRWHNLVM